MADIELYLGRFLILLVGILCLSSSSVQQERKVRYSNGVNIVVALFKVSKIEAKAQAQKVFSCISLYLNFSILCSWKVFH